jgi:anti-sigma B factor antagonist
MLYPLSYEGGRPDRSRSAGGADRCHTLELSPRPSESRGTERSAPPCLWPGCRRGWPPCARRSPAAVGDASDTPRARTLINVLLPLPVWTHCMDDSRFAIPGPRLGEGDEPPALQVVARDVAGAVAVVEVCGDLDTMTAPGFGSWMRDRLAGHADVVLDLDRVSFLASAGIAVLMGLRQEARRQGVRVHLTGRRNRAVSRPLEIVGLEAALELQDDVGSVVAELAHSV